MNLLKNLTHKLQAKRLKIATAESCTGGLIAAALTELAGSSSWFERGFITYSNLAKLELLGIDPKLIKDYGAVSEEVARAMVLGALKNSKADLALAVTGIAGPTGGTLEKPIGTVCFAWLRKAMPVQSLCRHFIATSRSEIRQLACEQALDGCLKLL